MKTSSFSKVEILLAPERGQKYAKRLNFGQDQFCPNEFTSKSV